MNLLPTRGVFWTGLVAAVCLVASYVLLPRTSFTDQASPKRLSPLTSNMPISSMGTSLAANGADTDLADSATSLPSHDVDLDLHGALAAFEDALAHGGEQLPQADFQQVDRLMTNLRLQAAAEASAD